MRGFAAGDDAVPLPRTHAHTHFRMQFAGQGAKLFYFCMRFSAILQACANVYAEKVFYKPAVYRRTNV